MTNLRKAAQGQQCQIRLYGICNFDPATTVLAHFRMIGISGAGLKPPDCIAAWACSACHDVVDGRRRSDLSECDVERDFARGVFRTQYLLIKSGIPLT